MYMSLQRIEPRTYLGKKQFLNFKDANFLAHKSGHKCEKQPVLGPENEEKFFGRYEFLNQ